MDRVKALLFGGSLRVCLVKLIVACALAALGAYFVLSSLAHAASEDSGLMSAYINERYEQSIDSLGNFIIDSDVTEASSGRLASWAKDNQAVEVEIFTEDGSIYASDFSIGSEAVADPESEDVPLYNRMRVYRLELADGTPVTAYLFGSFDLGFSMALNITSAAVSVAIFFVLFLLGVTRRISYIRRLENAVVAMGGGDLETPVEVRGTDELASLASQMDQMRVSFSEQIESEKRAKQANRDLVTTMSHDLRTPLTSLLLYVQILEDGKFRDKDEVASYIDKIYGRSMQIKVLSDSLFHHFLVEDEEPGQGDDEGPFGMVMGDLLSEFSSSLEAAGFEVILEGSLEDVTRPVSVSALSRVLDNLLSNLYKYALRNSTVRILAFHDERAGKAGAGLPAGSVERVVGLKITNDVDPAPVVQESTHIGLENIRALMSEMGGSLSCERHKGEKDGDPDTFTSVLEFGLDVPAGVLATGGRN